MLNLSLNNITKHVHCKYDCVHFSTVSACACLDMLFSMPDDGDLICSYLFAGQKVML